MERRFEPAEAAEMYDFHLLDEQMSWRRLALAAVGVLVTCLTPIAAHQRKTVGALQVTVGWSDEPAYSGFKNSVEVDITDVKGAPVTDLRDAALAVDFHLATSG